ncbi:MAG TPA: diacylglycerol kinase family protein [Sphingobium sp.]|nr:diacylglycerol kinase family protein [Sphingobium sp.]
MGVQSVAAPRAVALVSNPTSGGYSRAKLEQLCASFAAQQCRVHHYDSLSFKDERLDPDVDLICVFGGDGTLRTAIDNRPPEAGDVPYCVFPAGTINLVAREAGYHARLPDFVADIRARQPRRHIAGRIDQHVFLCCASVGPDSHAVARVSLRLKKVIGRLAYPVALVGLLFAWPRHRLTVEIDGAVHAAEGVFILKGRHYAGQWMLDGQADLTRDRFRVLLMPRARRRDFLRLVLSMLFGRAFADPRWRRLDARAVDIRSAAPLPVQADGDIVASTPIRIAVDPDALSFL